MKKENKVVVTYLKSLEASIEEAINKVSRCAPNEITDVFNELQSKVDSKEADKIETFIHTLNKKYG